MKKLIILLILLTSCSSNEHITTRELTDEEMLDYDVTSGYKKYTILEHQNSDKNRKKKPVKIEEKKSEISKEIVKTEETKEKKKIVKHDTAESDKSSLKIVTKNSYSFNNIFNLSIKEYKEMLEDYNKNNDYPNISK